MKKYLLTIVLTALTIVGFSCKNMNSKANNGNETLVSAINFNLSATQDTILDSIVEYLLDTSVKDFYDDQPLVPVGFRDVKFKQLTKPNNEKLYLICGQFLELENPNKEEWVSFATIKTDPYEQWLGSNASAYCQDYEEIIYSKMDLSVALKNKLETLQNTKK